MRSDAVIPKSKVRKRLERVERDMARQAEEGMRRGWPVLFWDRNCVERRVLRSLLGLREKPFNAADTMAGW
jgi:hypothetical protein